MGKLYSICYLVLLYVVIAFGQPVLDIPLTLSDGISSNNWYAIGVDTAATNGIDFALGESDLPPFPPAGTFEARFDLTPYAGEPLSSYKDYRNAPSLPFTGVVEYNLIWQLSTGASTFQISYSLPSEVTINIKDIVGGILFDSGPLTGTGAYSIPSAFISMNAAFITMTVAGPCPLTEATNPTPVDLQSNVQINEISLGWANGVGADNVEVWFGPNGRVLKLYDGAPINTWQLGTLNYGVIYSWFIVSKDAECAIQSPVWSFTTIQDTNLLIDSIIVYPQDLNNWTGSCNTSTKTQVSLVNGFNTEVGWMVFDITTIPNNVTINSVIFNGYLYDNSWPYWAITPMGNVNPVTDPASKIFNQVSSHSGQGIAYSYNEETGTLNNGWLTKTLASTSTLDFQNALTKNWFALGIVDIDFSTNYYVKFQGWAEANKPYLKIIYSFQGEETFQYSLDIDNSWNLISVPGLLPDNQNIDNWWQYRDQNASVFGFNASVYFPTRELVPGMGYWMKHSGDRIYNTGDEWPAEGIKIVRHDPISLVGGWNIFGAYEEIVQSTDLTTIPSGLINGPVFGYLGGYYIASQILPGYGYWIKLDNDGQIIIPDALLKSNNKAIEWFKDDWGKIIISDAAGKNFTLYAVNTDIDLNPYELPPLPPAGMFDIRYSSGRIAEDIISSIQAIDMSGVIYPLTVRVEGIDIRLMDQTGSGLNEKLKSGEEVIISKSSISKLMVSAEIVPDKYALEQNYPNPFNPSTNIQYSIGRLPTGQAGKQFVTLKVYDVLGNEIATLVNEEKLAGSYQVKFDGSMLSSGVYFYKLQTGDFVSSKKMILLR